MPICIFRNFISVIFCFLADSNYTIMKSPILNLRPTSLDLNVCQNGFPCSPFHHACYYSATFPIGGFFFQKSALEIPHDKKPRRFASVLIICV